MWPAPRAASSWARAWAMRAKAGMSILRRYPNHLVALDPGAAAFDQARHDSVADDLGAEPPAARASLEGAEFEQAHKAVPGLAWPAAHGCTAQFVVVVTIEPA